MYDLAIIGAGIVGLSTAYQLTKKNPSLSICILEKESAIAQHQSSHNSGVLHSGIYYQPGSLRAINCRAGHKQMVHFCRENQIRFELCGKLIVATRPHEVPMLQKIMENGRQNGLDGLRMLNKSEALSIEPHIRCEAAILVPQAGIVDYFSVADAFRSHFEKAGGEIIYGALVQQINQEGGSVNIHCTDKQINARYFINCAGLYADHIARLTEPELAIQILPFRGEYFELVPGKRHLVNHLIYPVPDPNFPFLGVHFTRMIDGRIEAGPNAVLAFRREGYHRSQIHLPELIETLRFSGFKTLAKKYWKTGLKELRRSFSKPYFVSALQKLIPEISESDVVRSRSGVRAMACHRNGALVDDFLIVPTKGGLHVLNAPSPAATASLAIGQEIISRVPVDIVSATL